MELWLFLCVVLSLGKGCANLLSSSGSMRPCFVSDSVSLFCPSLLRGLVVPAVSICRGQKLVNRLVGPGCQIRYDAGQYRAGLLEELKVASRVGRERVGSTAAAARLLSRVSQMWPVGFDLWARIKVRLRQVDAVVVRSKACVVVFIVVSCVKCERTFVFQDVVRRIGEVCCCRELLPVGVAAQRGQE